MAAPDPLVRAAGVVLVRPAPDGPRIAVIHRAHRADWSLPKGKVDPGEHVLAAAVRECDEETGLVPVLGVPLPVQEYVALGRPKRVDYWAATVAHDEGFAPDDEVDEVRWVAVDEAARLLTYPRDAEIVAMAAALPATSPLIVLRHTQAMKRADFAGDDDADRPLTGKGRSQAKALVPLLAAYGIEAVHSSDAARCQETVRRFAKSIDAPVHAEPGLSEQGFLAKPGRAEKRILALAEDPRPIVVCSHRPVLPGLMAALDTLVDPSLAAPPLDPRLSPGSFTVLHRVLGEPGQPPRIVAVETHHP